MSVSQSLGRLRLIFFKIRQSFTDFVKIEDILIMNNVFISCMLIQESSEKKKDLLGRKKSKTLSDSETGTLSLGHRNNL